MHLVAGIDPGYFCVKKDAYDDRKGKELAKIIRAQMHPDDTLFYFRSVDDNSGVVIKRSRVKLTDTLPSKQDELQLTLPLHQTPVQ